MASNNEMIYKEIKRQLNVASEQIEAENYLSFSQLDRYKKSFLTLLDKRLKDGAEKYEEEVPITIDQCMRSNRDNLLEAIEEYVDASVYQMADKLGSWSLESENDDKWADYYIFHQRSLAHLIYAYFLLRGALSKRAEINVNIKKKEDCNV
tara:strand:+ start:119 stop:571 length:453 start_codon:yes stop_codon:yes gene_type:complete